MATTDVDPAPAGYAELLAQLKDRVRGTQFRAARAANTFRVIVVAALALGVTGCSSSEPDPAYDPSLAELEAWKAAQTEQECPDVAQDETALDLVRTALDSGGDVTNVYGEDDPFDRVLSVEDHLWSRPNPAGDGVIVTAVQDGEGNLNQASRTRHRAI